MIEAYIYTNNWEISKNIQYFFNASANCIPDFTANINKTYELGSVDLTQGDVIVFRCWQNNSMTSNVRNTLGIVDTIAGTQYWHSTSANRHLSAGSHVYIYTVQNTGKHNFRLCFI